MRKTFQSSCLNVRKYAPNKRMEQSFSRPYGAARALLSSVVKNLSPLGGTGYASSLGLRSQLSNTVALFSMRHAPTVLRYK